MPELSLVDCCCRELARQLLRGRIPDRFPAEVPEQELLLRIFDLYSQQAARLQPQAGRPGAQQHQQPQDHAALLRHLLVLQTFSDEWHVSQLRLSLPQPRSPRALAQLRLVGSRLRHLELQQAAWLVDLSWLLPPRAQQRAPQAKHAQQAQQAPGQGPQQGQGVQGVQQEEEEEAVQPGAEHALRLTCLALRGCETLTSPALAPLQALAGSLRLLDLSGARCLDDGCAGVLASLRALQVINLNNTGVGDAMLAALTYGARAAAYARRYGVAAPAEAAAWPELGISRWHLAHTRVTAGGLALLAELPRLELLDVRGTGVPRAGLRPLETRFALALVQGAVLAASNALAALAVNCPDALAGACACSGRDVAALGPAAPQAAAARARRRQQLAEMRERRGLPALAGSGPAAGGAGPAVGGAVLGVHAAAGVGAVAGGREGPVGVPVGAGLPGGWQQEWATRGIEAMIATTEALLQLEGGQAQSGRGCSWDATRHFGHCSLCKSHPSLLYYPSEEAFQAHITNCEILARARQRFAEDCRTLLLGAETSSSMTSSDEDDESDLLGQDIGEVLRAQAVPPAAGAIGVMPTAGRVFIAKAWRNKYLDDEWRCSRDNCQAPGETSGFTLAVVGRAGAGKGSLINHLINSPQAFTSDSAGNSDVGVFKLSTDAGELSIKDIPGYDGPHHVPAPAATASSSSWWPWWPFASSHSSTSQQGSNAQQQTTALDIPAFLKHYGLLSSKLGDADAVLFVIGQRSGPPAIDILNTLTRHGKLVVLVFTHSENQLSVVKHEAREGIIPDASYFSHSSGYRSACRRRIASTLTNMTVERTHLAVQDLEYMLWQVPTFFTVTRLPCAADAAELGAAYSSMLARELEENRGLLDLPRLRNFLERGDLVRRLRLFRRVEEEVEAALRPFFTKQGWAKVLASGCYAVGSALVTTAVGVLTAVASPPATLVAALGLFAGNAVRLSATSLYTVLEMCDAVGLLPETNWRERIGSSSVLWTLLTAEGASKASVQDGLSRVMVQTFGDLSPGLVGDIVQLACASGSLLACVPVVGNAAEFASTLSDARRVMARVVQRMAVATHRRWVTENLPTPHTVRYYKAGAEGAEAEAAGAL
ncbi:hypothetical protein HYH03_002167 [Edaphochlamys debaryana]|nr:hypothetical protein HYH03_002167 [Edaphochlamys debaryana]|eukprot:KAG2499878.1 hypothetical protein HYH03_002167 [Edaphochlamys debaryana]